MSRSQSAPIISGYINNLSLRSIDAGKFWARSAIRHSMLRSSGTMATSDSQLITAADNMIVLNGEQVASDMILQYEGMLFKRQRGRSLRKGSGNRTRLKFQTRFCVLNNTGFTYKPKKSDKSKMKDIFPIGRIKFVKDVAPDVFSEYSLSGIDDQHCFQFGDEQEVLYFIAPTEKEKKLWMSTLEQAARNNGNEMLKTYHRGSYGSKRPEEWSCCGYCGKNQEGCFSVSDDSMVHPRRPIRKTSHTDEPSKKLSQANAKSLRSYSVDSTMHMASLMQQSGGHGPLLTGTKPVLSLKEDDRDTSYVCLVRSYNQETTQLTSDAEDNYTIATRHCQAMTTDNLVHFSIDGRYEMNKASKSTQPTMSLTDLDYYSSVDQPTRKQHCQLQEREQKNSAYSYNLSEPLTALKLHQHQLISGNQMLHVWDKTPELTLTASLKLAGEVHSLDTWKDFIAVGSSVVQVIKLNPINDPKRTLYIKGENKLAHSDGSFSCNPLLVSFVGDGGVLASATVGGNTVDIWDPPSTESYKVITKPKSKITFDDHKIVSLTASKEPNESWMVVITKTNGHIKASVSDWKSSSPYRMFEISEDHDISNIYAHLNGIYLVVGYGGNISVMDTQTGRNTCSKILDQTLSCLSGSKGEILIGTTSGDVIAFSEDDLTQINRFTNNTAPVVAIAVEEDFSSVYIAYGNGDLKVWSASDGFNDIHDSVPGLTSIHDEEEQAFDCVLGQQLCSEGILTQRQVFRLSTHGSLSFPFKDNGASIKLPSEILKYPDPVFEAAFSPFGPVGTQFILPEKMIPVSSAVWLCVSPYEKFQSPATLKISHCFSCNSSEDAKLLHFLKAEHKDIKRDKFGNSTIKFEEVDPDKSEFPSEEQTGTLKDNHFCIYCLVAVGEEKDVLGRINYCLTILKPKHYPTKENMKIYCILHFDLEGCKKLVEEQTPKDYDTVTKYLQFTTGRFQSALQMKLNKAEAEKCGWVITIESEKEIFAEDVNFFNYRKVDYLKDACKTSDVHKPYPYAYPPRFVLEVSARYAKQYSTIELTFTGSRRDLYTEIQLHPLRCEDDLNGPPLVGTIDADDVPIGQSQPLPFPNGNWDPETG